MSSTPQGVYLDSSAIVKLVVAEAESVPLREWLDADTTQRWVTCALAVVEVGRACRLHGLEPGVETPVLHTMSLIPINLALLRASVGIGDSRLRSLDALHLAAAALVPDLVAVVTYDLRQAAAARSLDLPVAAPAPG